MLKAKNKLAHFSRYLRNEERTKLLCFISSASGAKKFTLQQYLKRQRHLLHGMESRNLKHIPKVRSEEREKLTFE